MKQQNQILECHAGHGTHYWSPKDGQVHVPTKKQMQRSYPVKICPFHKATAKARVKNPMPLF